MDEIVDEPDGYGIGSLLPCRRTWELCSATTEYVHRSAKFYMTGEGGIYPVTHLGELSEIKLIGDERY